MIKRKKPYYQHKGNKAFLYCQIWGFYFFSPLSSAFLIVILVYSAPQSLGAFGVFVVFGFGVVFFAIIIIKIVGDVNETLQYINNKRL